MSLVRANKSAQNVMGVLTSSPTGVINDPTTGTLAIGDKATGSGLANTLVGNLIASGGDGGSFNTVIGYSAAPGVSSDDNVIVGAQAGLQCINGGRNVLLGSRADVFSAADTGSIVIGAFARSGGPGSIVIGDAVSATGQGGMNIGNKITGIADSTSAGGYVMLVGGPTVSRLRLSTSSNVVMESPLLFTAGAGQQNWWRIAPVPATNDGLLQHLQIRSRNNTVITFQDTFVPGVLNFTGQHRCMPAVSEDVVSSAWRIGSIVTSCGRIHNLDGSMHASVNEALPVVDLSRKERDPCVFGVYAGTEESTADTRPFNIGNMVFHVPLESNVVQKKRVIINSTGEGGILVCDWNGLVQNGDYLTSSPLPGIAMRQDGDALCRYTVAKATSDAQAASDDTTSMHGMRTVHVAFVGCIYTC